MKITGVNCQAARQWAEGNIHAFCLPWYLLFLFFHLGNFFTVLSLGGFFVSKLENKMPDTVQHLRLALSIKAAEVGALIWAHASAWSSRLANLTG